MARRAWERFRSWPGWAQGVCWAVVGLVALGVVFGEDGDADEPAEQVEVAHAAASDSAPTTVASTTTTTEPTTTTTAGAPAARLLDGLVVGEENAPIRYDRESFDEGIDADGDGCRTRCEVLALQRLDDVVGLPAGGWLSIYDGHASDDPTTLEMDHVVALAEAWRSGAWAWDLETRRAFANDQAGLLIVSSPSNQAKADHDPSEWRPPDEGSWCRFATIWTQMKVRYGLTAQQSEVDALAAMLDGCTVAPGELRVERVPVVTTTTTTAPPPVVVPPAPVVGPVPTVAPPAPTPPPPPAGNCDPSYPTVCIPPSPPDLDCPDIAHRRFQVVGSDPHRFDGDNDGIGCES